MTKLIELKGINKTYKNGDQELRVLKDIDLEVEKGEFVAIMGPSGSGKSTLMNVIGLLDRPTSGDYFLDGQEVGNLSEKKLAHVRNEQIGFVFQQFSSCLNSMPFKMSNYHSFMQGCILLNARK